MVRGGGVGFKGEGGVVMWQEFFSNTSLTRVNFRYYYMIITRHHKQTQTDFDL